MKYAILNESGKVVKIVKNEQKARAAINANYSLCAVSIATPHICLENMYNCKKYGLRKIYTI